MKTALIASMMLSDQVFKVQWIDENEYRVYIGPIEFTAVLRELNLSCRSEQTPSSISVALPQKP